MKINRIKKLTILAETKYLNLYEAEYENRKGDTKHWTIASRKDFDTLKGKFFEGKKQNIDAVIIAALHKESNCLVLIRQFRVPLNDYVYEIPAGLLDGDEPIEHAVDRELREETGLKLIKINHEKSKDKIYVSVGMTDEAVAMVYCTCEGEISNKYLEDDEDIEAVLISQEEAKELLKKDINMDIKALMTLQGFAALGDALF